MPDYAENKKILGLDPLLGADVTDADGFIVGDASDTGKAKYVLRTQMAAALQMVVGTNVQAYSASLSAISALTPSNNDILQYKAGAWANRTVAQYKADLAYTTDEVSEGSNLYFTTARVLATALAGLSITGGSISSSDSILAAFGKLQNQLNSVLGGAAYQGTWNASTNTPSLASGTGTQGYYYVVSVDGSTNLDGITDWKVGDWAIFNGTTWDKVDNTDAVSSVNGQIGAVSLTTTEINEGTNLYYTAARFNSAFSSKSTSDLSEGTNLYFTNARAIASTLTGYTSGAGTISASDTVLSAIQKLNGNIAALSGGGGVEIKTASLGSTQDDYVITGMSTSAGVVTILKVTPTTSFKFTGFSKTISSVDVEDGKTVIITNETGTFSASSRLILLERGHSGSGSTSANRMTFTPGLPVFIMPSESITMRYSTSLATWRIVATSTQGSPANLWTFFTDCYSLGELINGASGSGAGAAIDTNFLGAGTSYKPIGLISLSTGTTTSGLASWSTTASFMRAGGGSCNAILRVGIVSTLSTGGDTYIDIIGFIDAVGTSNFQDCVFWEYDSSVSTGWITGTMQGGTATRTSQGPAASTSQMPYFGIYCNGDWTNIEYYYSTDGETWTFCATAHTTNIPSGTQYTGFGCSRRKTAGTNARKLEIDLMGFIYNQKRGA